MIGLYKENNQILQIPYKVVAANTFFTRLKGLMFRTSPIIEEALFISPCNSVHTFFMKFSIDIIFLDRNNCVIEVKKNVHPRKMIFSIKNACSVIEMPTGSISKFSIEKGDKIFVK